MQKTKETYLIEWPFKGSAHSVVYYFEDGTNRVLYTDGLTLEQYKLQYINRNIFEVSKDDLNKFMDTYLDSLVTAPKKITEERYNEMLNVLPPSKWGNYRGVESFHICERLTCNLVNWFVKAGNLYYEFTDFDTLSNVEVYTKFTESLK